MKQTYSSSEITYLGFTKFYEIFKVKKTFTNQIFARAEDSQWNMTSTRWQKHPKSAVSYMVGTYMMTE
uniref:Uncharacterized protein n=1 Tax=Romanomermis culicivorax TaxID=13658 RepID=A0A915K3P2_ROMCU